MILGMAALTSLSTVQFRVSDILGTRLKPYPQFPIRITTMSVVKPFVIEARGNTRVESPKTRNRRSRKKFTGTQTKPRLSVFCSDKQLYAMLVDDFNKKCLFYASTLQKSIRGDPPCTVIEAAKRVGEELIKASIDLKINEISSYDRNGNKRGERMQAFEIAIAQHGFLP
ncbi:Ribosomal L18p/L5e family protein [Arabidopsis thaliana]|jgi:ribosomal protein L18|uniref:Ribosomal L18p/L5e family protein n=2 Tax=Arabidopsis thaliana TaxID=3702 RepID=F4HUG8_ARATH|nr:Ribosomal L18p/L5e family protein [Arabidopsis thaliana]AEE29122.2 Ribosomal L18p/L5e family protein [Arabidopsis thaliana]|eukprot:NP_683305.3 Ribosomal L18p/L5e family protein [Arabidopsis thaliana]